MKMDTIQGLIRESHKFIELAEQIQQPDCNEQERKVRIEMLSGKYHDWYRRSLTLLAAYDRPDIKRAFEQEYNPAGAFSFHKIQKFLQLGWKTHRIAGWVAKYESAFKEPLENQCNLLASLGESLSNSMTTGETQTVNYTTHGSQEDYSIELYQILTDRFNEEELDTLCFYLKIDNESLGNGKANKARELIKYLKRRELIPELIRHGKQIRPDISWPNVTSLLPVGSIDGVSTYHFISFAQIANANISEKYRNPPIAEENDLLGVSFQVKSGRSIYDSAVHLREGENSVGIYLDKPFGNLRSLYLLINSGGSYKEHEGKQIGRIQLLFRDGVVQETKLILGENIREWAPGNLPNLVDQVKSASSVEVWQGTNQSGKKAVIDRLEIPIFQQNRQRELEQIIVFHDMEGEIPALLVFAATAEIVS